MPQPPKFGVTVDVVLFTIRESVLTVLMVRRKHEPFQGRWAFPGGFVDPDEDLPDAALRELEEETGIRSPDLRIDQLWAYGDPDRDPRGRTISIAFIAVGHHLGEPQAADDADAAVWRPVHELVRSPESLAFDHAHILRDGLERLRNRIESTELATRLLPAEVTVAELRAAYELVRKAVATD